MPPEERLRRTLLGHALPGSNAPQLELERMLLTVVLRRVQFVRSRKPQPQEACRGTRSQLLAPCGEGSWAEEGRDKGPGGLAVGVPQGPGQMEGPEGFLAKHLQVRPELRCTGTHRAEVHGLKSPDLDVGVVGLGSTPGRNKPDMHKDNYPSKAGRERKDFSPGRRWTLPPF